MAHESKKERHKALISILSRNKGKRLLAVQNHLKESRSLIVSLLGENAVNGICPSGNNL